MNILLTNDDGYKASGINQLFKSLSAEHKVFLIAPREDCSGMSAAISLRKEIKVEEISKNIFFSFRHTSRLLISWIVISHS
jgi:5'-nucleotidase